MSEEPSLSEPVLPGEGGSDYERYLRTDELLALQKGPDEWVHRDELLFQTVHQSSELWLKLATSRARGGDARSSSPATSAARSGCCAASIDCLKLVTAALDMLEHLAPWEYRRCARCSATAAASTRPASARSRGSTPALGEAFQAALRARPGSALVELYIARAASTRSSTSSPSCLIEWDERVVVWRVRHFVVVERIIGGSVIGTQGTPVEVLGRLIHKRFFPELWAGAQRAHGASRPRRERRRALAAALPRLRQLRRHRLGAGLLRPGARARRRRSRSWTPPRRPASTGSTPPTPTAAGASEAFIGRWRAARAARRAAPDDQGVQPGRRRPRRPRPRARAHRPRARGEPRAARRRADRPLPRPRARPRDADRRDASRPSRSCAHAGLIGAWGLSNYDAAGIERGARATAARRSSRTPTRCSSAATRPRVLPLCAARGHRLRPLRAARRRLADRQVPPRRAATRPGSRMTHAARALPPLRRTTRVFDGLERARRRGRRARRRDGDARVRLGALPSRRQRRRLRPLPARASRSPCSPRSSFRLDAGERERIGSFFR